MHQGPLLCFTHKWIKSNTLKVATCLTHNIDSSYVNISVLYSKCSPKNWAVWASFDIIDSDYIICVHSK